MKKAAQLLGLVALAAVVGLGVAGCEQPTDSKVSVSGVILDQTSLTLTAGGTGELLATVSPGNATNKTLIWTTSNSGVASVNNGTVTANAAGSAIITVTTDDGGKQAACTVTVSNRINAQNPVITSQPTGGAVTVGHPHGLSVTANASDGGALSYRWYRNTSASNTGATLISGATSATYNPPTGTIGTYYYFVEVTNTIQNNGDGGNKIASVRSNVVTLTVNNLVNAKEPTIISQPSGGTVIFGGSRTLSVTASRGDNGTLSYQWYNNIGASNSGGTVITGATSRTYNPPTGTTGTYYYFVEVTNSITDNGDGGNKAASVRSNAVAVTVNEKVDAQIPIITSQPTSATVTVNHLHTLSVTASRGDNGTLSYRWYSNTSASNTGGTLISGATSAAYNPPTGTEGTFYYFVEVTNTIVNNGDGGNKTEIVRSNAVTLMVNNLANAEEPNITNQPIGGTVIFGGSHTLSVTANSPDGGTLSYQWYNNTSASNTGGTLISGATSAAYNPPTGTEGTFYYFVEVTNTIANNGDGGVKAASIRSNPVAVTINQEPVASDFDVGNLTQTVGSVTPVTITPKVGMSTGAITIYYNGSTALPTTAGTYTVTFNVAAATGWSAVTGLAGGILTVNKVQQSFFIAFDQITDTVPAIIGPTISRSGANGQTTATLVMNPADYDNGSIIWRITGTTINGTGATFTLNWDNTAHFAPGNYHLTVEVTKNGVPYNKTVIFTIAE